MQPVQQALGIADSGREPYPLQWPAGDPREPLQDREQVPVGFQNSATGPDVGFYKAQVLDNDDGVVVDYSVECGAVPDGPQLVPAIMQVARRSGHVPPAVTADRGYGQAAVERDLHAAGVRTVVIPRQATTSAARKALEHSRGFRKLVKWRTGCEGRISYLKHRYSWDRTRLDGRTGAAIWCGHGVFAHNLVKIGALVG